METSISPGYGFCPSTNNQNYHLQKCTLSEEFCEVNAGHTEAMAIVLLWVLLVGGPGLLSSCSESGAVYKTGCGSACWHPAKPHVHSRLQKQESCLHVHPWSPCTQPTAPFSTHPPTHDLLGKVPVPEGLLLVVSWSSVQCTPTFSETLPVLCQTVL